MIRFSNVNNRNKTNHPLSTVVCVVWCLCCKCIPLGRINEAIKVYVTVVVLRKNHAILFYYKPLDK